MACRPQTVSPKERADRTTQRSRTWTCETSIILHKMWTMEAPVTKPTTLNVRISGALGAFVAANIGDEGAYENISEYVRDLIRRDKARVEGEAFDRLKAELAHAFAAPDGDYTPLSADMVIARNARPKPE